MLLYFLACTVFILYSSLNYFNDLSIDCTKWWFTSSSSWNFIRRSKVVWVLRGLDNITSMFVLLPRKKNFELVYIREIHWCNITILSFCHETTKKEKLRIEYCLSISFILFSIINYHWDDSISGCLLNNRMVCIKWNISIIRIMAFQKIKWTNLLPFIKVRFIFTWHVAQFRAPN